MPRYGEHWAHSREAISVAKSIRQDEYRQELTDRLDTITGRASMLCDALSPTQLGWAPPGGGWGVGQVIEHLIAANESYFKPIGLLLDKHGAHAGKAQGVGWAPSVMGHFLARSLANPRKLPAPKIYRPKPTPRPGVIEAFLESQLEMKQLLIRAADVTWARVRLRSPVTSLIRLNLGDAFNITVVHEERHFGQIDRVMAMPGFP